MGKFFLKIILTLFFYVLSPFLFIFVSAVATLRFFVSKVVRCLDPGVDRILTARSSGPGTDKTYEAPKMTLVTVSTYEGTIDFETLRAEFESRVVFARNDEGKLLRPELRQYITRRFGFTFWKNDRFYSIINHVRLYDGKFQKEYANSGGITPEMILAACEEMLYGPFVSKRSPWELHVFQNYKDSPDSPISTALALRIHHSLGDGFSILNLTKDLLNEGTVKSGPSRQQSCLTQLTRYIGFLFLAPYEFISETLDAHDVPTWKVKEANLTKNFNFGVSPMIPLEEIKQVRKLAKASFTAVILACFTGALRRFMTEAGHKVPKRIHCVTPLPMAGHPGRKMRNHMAGCITALPVGMTDPLDRLQKIDQDLLKLRNSTYPVTLFHFMGLVGTLFRCMIKPFTANFLTTAIMSNFPGPDTPMGFNQHKLRSMYFCGGLFRGTCAMGFSALSCAGNIRFVFGLDEALVRAETLPASQLVAYFLEELEIIKGAAMNDSTIV